MDQREVREVRWLSVAFEANIELCAAWLAAVPGDIRDLSHKLDMRRDGLHAERCGMRLSGTTLEIRHRSRDRRWRVLTFFSVGYSALIIALSLLARPVDLTFSQAHPDDGGTAIS